jgi:outer membrane phospholipase A
MGRKVAVEQQVAEQIHDQGGASVRNSVVRQVWLQGKIPIKVQVWYRVWDQIMEDTNGSKRGD